MIVLFFFFQAEDGIRDLYVTGVQTCALPILQAGDLGLQRRAFVGHHLARPAGIAATALRDLPVAGVEPQHAVGHGIEAVAAIFAIGRRGLRGCGRDGGEQQRERNGEEAHDVTSLRSSYVFSGGAIPGHNPTCSGRPKAPSRLRTLSATAPSIASKTAWDSSRPTRLRCAKRRPRRHRAWTLASTASPTASRSSGWVI